MIARGAFPKVISEANAIKIGKNMFIEIFK